MGLSDTNICPKCEMAEETVSHFLGQCPAYDDIRSSIFNTIYSNTKDIFNSNSLNQILQYADYTERLNRETDSITHSSGVT